jgi:hypothetical protein
MISTRLLQTLSMAVLGACGIVGLFAPEVLLSAISMAEVTPHWPVQLLAAAWLALAIFNWSTRGFAMGGIYGRPVVLTNFTFYFVAAMSTVRPVLFAPRPGPLVVLVVFGVFAVAYGLLLFARGPAAGADSRG